jgi:predicted PilT family ATPase
VSGNEVPPGALQEEVRDDIPAQLSEGEFVFPADVVRFIGLENLMKLRQSAKEGLAKMESMGQMSNADEATEEDDGAFESDIDDILSEIENETNGSQTTV